MMPSGSELLLIAVAVLVLFGGKRLPQILRNVGKGIRELQKAARDVKREIDLDAIDREEQKKKDLQG